MTINQRHNILKKLLYELPPEKTLFSINFCILTKIYN